MGQEPGSSHIELLLVHYLVSSISLSALKLLLLSDYVRA